MSESATKPNWGRRIGFALLSMLALIGLLVIIAFLWIGSGSGQRFVEDRVERLNVSGQSVQIDGLDGSVLGQFEIDEISLTGPEGEWLIARDIDVDWSPWSLLSKSVQINEVRVGDIDVLQRPVLARSEQGGGSPVNAVYLDQLDLPEVSLDEAVLGRALQVALNGSAKYTPEGGQTNLTLTSDQGDRAVADLAWSAENVLSGDADISGPTGGLLTQVLRLEEGQAVTAVVTTEGDTTQIISQIDQTDFVRATILRDNGTGRIDGRVDLSRFPLAERARPALGGPADITATVPLDADGDVSLTVRAPKLDLQATGTRQDGIIRLDDLQIDATNPLEGYDIGNMSLGRITVRGQAEIGDSYQFNAQVDGQNIDYQDYAIDRLSGPVTLRLNEGVLDFDTALQGEASGEMARINNARLNSSGQLNLSTQIVRLDRANIRIPGLEFQGSGTLGYGDTVSANIEGRYTLDSAVFREGPSARLSGQARVGMADGRPTVRLSGQATNFGNLPEAVLPLTKDRLNYEVRIRSEDGRIVIPSFSVSNEGLNASGSAAWQNGQLSSDFDYTVTDYKMASLTLARLSGQASLTGPPSDLAIVTQADAQDVRIGTIAMEAGSVDLNGRYGEGVFTAQLTLNGRSDYGPVDVTAQLRTEGSDWSVSDLNGTLAGLSATGAVSGAGGDIAALRGNLQIDGQTEFLPAESVDATLLLSDSQIDARVRLGSLTMAQLQGTDVNLTARGPRSNVSFTINADGQVEVQDIVRPMTFEASGTADLEEPGLSVEAPFSLNLGRQSATGQLTAARGDLGWSGQLVADALGGAIDLTLDPSASDDLSVQARNVTVADVMLLLGRPVADGTISIRSVFRRTETGLDGRGELSISGLKSPESDSEPVSLEGNFTLLDDQLNARITAADGSLDGGATITGPVSTQPTAPFISWPPSTPLETVIDLTGDIGPVAELFLPPLTDVTGQVDMNLTMTVPVRPDRLDGRISLTGGQVEQGDLGLFLTDIAMNAVLSGETITVSNVSARGSEGGTLSGSGQMGLGEGTGAVDMRAQDLRVIARREGYADVSGTLSLSRTTELFRLSGDLDVTDAEIDIARLPQPGLPTLDVRFSELDEDEDEAASAASRRTDIDLSIRSDGRINVKGRGLDALMTLDASVTGSFDNPILSGEAGIARGRFDFLGKRFEFQDADVQLMDEIMQSRLNMTAIRETADLTATVAIRGTFERPEIDLSSDPTLPEDEVLSRILFGRSPTQLTVLETARLAGALAQLSGGGGLDVLGSLENAVGLDTLDVGQSETGQTQVTTGKYLSDDVYLEVRSAAEGSPGVAVEWQARRNIAVEAETVPGESQSVFVQWKKDFD